MTAIRCFCLDCDGRVTYSTIDAYLDHKRQLDEARQTAIANHPTAHPELPGQLNFLDDEPA
jgi:hypothetical protein